MGALLSKSKKDSGDYEKILSELDGKIQKAEIKLSEIKVRERQWCAYELLFGIIFWAVYLLYCFLTLNTVKDDFESLVLQLSPVILWPAGVYYVRKALVWSFGRWRANQEIHLSGLRAEQKLRLEELKKKTAYYTTKSLLDRYDQAEGMKSGKQSMLPTPPQSGGRAPAVPASPVPPPQQQPQPVGSVRPLLQMQTSTAIHPPQPPRERQWYDRLVDTLVGEDGPETKFALICNHCFAHNGLVLPEEIDVIQYTCPHCKKFNSSRKSRQLHPDGPVIPPPSPSPSPSAERILSSDDDQDTIASRVRKRHSTQHPRESNSEEKHEDNAKTK